MNEERQLSLNDTFGYVARNLRNQPQVSVERMREIASQVSAVDDATKMKETILHLAGVAPTVEVA